MARFSILSPTAILGYGFPRDSFERGLACRPDLIAVDAGSADPGPYYLGTGKSFTDRAAVRRDLSLLLPAAVGRGIPLVIGGAGAAPHLQWTLDIVQELARELRLSFRLGSIAADISRQTLLAGLAGGRVQALTAVPQLTPEAVGDSAALLAQMGVEPLQQALAAGCTVVVAGRAYDPAVFAALPMLRGFNAGLALHLGKILECAAILAQVRVRVDALLPELARQGGLHFHVYGRDGVMGLREPRRHQPAHELGIVIDAVCATPEAADTLCSLTRSTLLHFGYRGRMATAGNLAFPFSPSDLRAGEVYEFSVYHLLQADPLALFPLTVREVRP